MRRCIFFFGVLFIGFLYLSDCIAQTSFVFSSQNGINHITADSIKVFNITKACDTTLHIPDTVLNIGGNTNSINNQVISDFEITKALPNPVRQNAVISVTIPDNGELSIETFTETGIINSHLSVRVTTGIHNFRITPSNEGLVIVKATFNKKIRSIKFISLAKYSVNNEIDYISFEEYNYSDKVFKSGSTNFSWESGDKLGLVTYFNDLQSALTDSPIESKAYTFQFATNISCPGIDSIQYGNKYYQTVQIFNQCWMQENLDFGKQINSTVNQTNNDTIEKYCLLNDSAQCDRYGALYTWNEMMNYQNRDENGDICPEGWHIASDDDFMILEGSIDSQYGIFDSEWENFGENGFDAGKKLKSSSGWYNGGNGSNEYGFTALWGGFLYQGNWAGGDLLSTFYTSSEFEENTDQAIIRNLSWMWDKISKSSDNKLNARPVRCIKNF